MREFTKSVMSYTWALSMLGVQQVVNLFTPGGRGSGNKATEAFQKLTEATTQEMGESLRATFRAGDNLQRSLVDLMFSACTLGALDPGRWARAAADAARRTVPSPTPCGGGQGPAAPQYRPGFGEPFRQARSPEAPASNGTPESTTASSSAQGWGPMP